jgi:hypothetical protein
VPDKVAGDPLEKIARKVLGHRLAQLVKICANRIALLAYKSIYAPKESFYWRINGSRGNGLVSEVEISNEIKRRRTFAIISHPDNSVADKPGQHATKKRKYPMIYEEYC